MHDIQNFVVLLLLVVFYLLSRCFGFLTMSYIETIIDLLKMPAYNGELQNGIRNRKNRYRFNAVIIESEIVKIGIDLPTLIITEHCLSVS